MSEWIELNLPYDVLEFFDPGKDLVYPDLSEKAKKQIGYNQDDLAQIKEDTLPKYDDYERYDKLHEIDDEISANLNQHFEDQNDEWKAARVAALKNHDNEDAKSLGRYLEKVLVLDNWKLNQPEIIAWDAEYKKRSKLFHEENNKKSFSGIGLNKPGTLVEVELDGKLYQFLIGHINNVRGVCDDCVQFDRSTIVKRYKVIWSEEE